MTTSHFGFKDSQFGFTAAYQKAQNGATIADTTTWQGAPDGLCLGVAKLFSQHGRMENICAQPSVEQR